MWSNAATTPETTYSWADPGSYTVVITGTNCDGASVVTDTLVVDVYEPCIPLTGVEISGATSLLVGETGLFNVSLIPPDATDPSITWSNGITGTQAAYSWKEPGTFYVTVTAMNCGGTVMKSQAVEVILSSYPVWLPLILRTQAR
jgi:hypothetical protein